MTTDPLRISHQQWIDALHHLGIDINQVLRIRAEATATHGGRLEVVRVRRDDRGIVSVTEPGGREPATVTTVIPIGARRDGSRPA